MGVLSNPVPVSAPPTGLDECLFFISLVSDPLAVRFSVSSGCGRRRSVSTYAAILVLRANTLNLWDLMLSLELSLIVGHPTRVEELSGMRGTPSPTSTLWKLVSEPIYNVRKVN